MLVIALVLLYYVIVSCMIVLVMYDIILIICYTVRLGIASDVGFWIFETHCGPLLDDAVV